MPIIDPKPGYSTTSPRGWACSNCGFWVAEGVTHTCTFRMTQQIRLTDTEIERIARGVVELLKAAPGILCIDRYAEWAAQVPDEAESE